MMTEFTIEKDFLIDGQPFKIISGSIHYFRVHPDYWQHSLRNLKAMGCNTVETYVPWSIYEIHEGQFNFNAFNDIERFIQLATDLGLYVIVRPSPFVCAEWEFGGLPGWLLNYPEMDYRTSDPVFMEKVARFYSMLLPRLKPYQITEGGRILMMQVENEYGSYGNDQEYLKALVALIRLNGITVPLFTSDGSWDEALTAGSLVTDGVLATGNFGSKADQNFDQLEAFFDRNAVQMPLMCMEFWDGWFNRYNEPIIRRDPEEFASTLKTMLRRGSLNFYMFHGGTNFGFMNGCSTRGQKRLPQVTSYDYDALLTEAGDPTRKYALAQSILAQYGPTSAPESLPKTTGTLTKVAQCGLFDSLTQLSQKVIKKHPKTMESFDQYYGYILYRTQVKSVKKVQKALLVEAHDRAHIFVNGQLQKTLYQESLTTEFTLNLDEGCNQIDILVENMGRVNYGSLLQSPGQRKGIARGLMVDLHFEANWEIYPLPLDNVQSLDFKQVSQDSSPVQFGQYTLELDGTGDTFIDIRQLGKGTIFVNGFNLGRYWQQGPIGYLYLPAPLLKQGDNQIVIFETEQALPEQIALLDKPVYIETANQSHYQKATAPI
ncbi:glycoside hydrolase family 35 protein [Latilactobacillus curvatus]|uniref:glycoside hydrolase family 35 protein n=2 Tax=Latilactobacillus curvatus TaxID=28038 RepID=UPI002916D312|nr:beta-galactosidase [Latilactobacillus curvatus]